MVKLQANKGRFFVSIPKDLIKGKRWEKGQELLLTFNEKGNIEISELT